MAFRQLALSSALNSSNTRLIYWNYFRFFQDSLNIRKSIGTSFVQPRESEQSYVQHTLGGPLVYRNLGQQLRLTAEQLPNQEAIVSCYEDKRLTFSDVLEKVSSIRDKKSSCNFLRNTFF